ncbi:MAG: hypothetical protein Q9163_002807 [Psora crenata]
MMQQRPTFIDLRSKTSDSIQTGLTSPRAFPSPRMQHLDGDIPPAMSPLDMFAAQSRMLAKQLDDSKRNGRRVSRLPPLTTTDPITKQKSLYHRSQSAGQTSPLPGSSPRQREEDPTGIVPEVEEPQFRPKSFYPRVSHIPGERDESSKRNDDDDHHHHGPSRAPPALSPEKQSFVTPADFPAAKTDGYFGIPRAGSPETLMTASVHSEPAQRSPPYPPHQQYEEPAYQLFNSNEPRRGMSTASTSSRGCSSSLLPPKSPRVKQASIRSMPMDSSDDEHSASTAESGFSRNRKLSSSSNVSLPYSPSASFVQAHRRSPSVNSDYSIGGSLVPRPAFNFSRPLSRASQPSYDIMRRPSFDTRPAADAVRPPFSCEQRKTSADSQGFLFVDDAVHTPMGTTAEEAAEAHEGQNPPAPSYIYTKFLLPRGRTMQTTTGVPQANDVPLSEKERPQAQSNARPTTPLTHPSTSPTSPSGLRSTKISSESQRASPRPSIEQKPRHSPASSRDLHKASPPLSFEQRSRNSPRPSFEQRLRYSPRLEQRRPSSRPSTEQPPQLSLPPQADMPPLKMPMTSDDESGCSASTRSGSTVKAHPRPPADPLELSAEGHLAKGIDLHERGEARESTYHLRIAAKQNLPTAMLLYALACRHGWGMRPNPQEGVQWLRRAADCASLEVAVDEDSNNGDVQERKTRRAQFALSIYELGHSHYNGWGIEQDRTLALRCFEIAANWGDADAMTEAGFCYAKGEGCKKDLKKAAKYYRMAEAKGMSMVGNSWIYKPKYADDVVDKGSGTERQSRGAVKEITPEKKPRDKSRTRAIFGRKKSLT